MGRGRLWRRDGRRLWRWPGGGGSANRPWHGGSREGHLPAAPPSTPPPLPAAEGPSQCRPGDPRSHPASPRHAQPSGRAGPRRVDLRGAVQTGRMSLYFFVYLLLLCLVCSSVALILMYNYMQINIATGDSGMSKSAALTLAVMLSVWRTISATFLKYLEVSCCSTLSIYIKLNC